MKFKSRAAIPVIVWATACLLAMFLIVGEVRCVVRAVRCDWAPIGKSEVIYTASALTGLGGVVGWINIED